MEIKRLSASAFNTFKKCEFAYYVSYCLGMKQPPTLKTSIGTVVHAALEEWAKGNLNYVESLKIAYVENKIDEFPETTTKTFQLCVSLTERVLQRPVNPITQYEIIGVEHEFNMVLSSVPVIGYIDLLQKTEDGIFVIRDWKTGSFIKSYEDVKDDFQTQLYDIAVNEVVDPGSDAIVVMDYIQSHPVTIAYTDGEREHNKNTILNTIKKIRSIKKPRRIPPCWVCDRMCIKRAVCDKLYADAEKCDFNVDKMSELYNITKKESTNDQADPK
mgnify:CR=1 FL=1